jgi:hypothetical protein
VTRLFKTITVEQPEGSARPISGIDIALVKPSHPGKLSKLGWITVLQSLISKWEQ